MESWARMAWAFQIAKDYLKCYDRFVTKTEELEAKINKVADLVDSLRRENNQLKTENMALQAHVTLLTTESQKAQRIIADHDQLRKKHDQVTHRIERALQNLTNLRSS